MLDETCEFLDRGARVSTPTWGFETIWRRSERRRIFNRVGGAAAFAGMVMVVALAVSAIDLERPAQTPNPPAAPAVEATWQRMPAAPVEGRYRNVAVWTGEEMIVWGGFVGESSTTADGAAFDPRAREWRRLGESPLADAHRTAVWTGQEMVLWGGEEGDHEQPDNGAAYEPRTDTWRELPESPYWSLANHSAVWTGQEMIVFGGVSPTGYHPAGAAFDPRAGVWRTIAQPPIEGRWGHSAVWTGSEMIVWGGGPGGNPHADGAAYDPVSDTWRELPPAPISGRDFHAAVWTGEEMIVWGGWSGRDVTPSDGAAYDPDSNTWRELPRAPIAPPGSETGAVWTGRELVVTGPDGEVAIYTPADNAWTVLGRRPDGSMMSSSLVGAGRSIIFWGGVPSDDDGLSNDGVILHLSE